MFEQKESGPKEDVDPRFDRMSPGDIELLKQSDQVLENLDGRDFSEVVRESEELLMQITTGIYGVENLIEVHEPERGRNFVEKYRGRLSAAIQIAQKLQNSDDSYRKISLQSIEELFRDDEYLDFLEQVFLELSCASQNIVLMRELRMLVRNKSKKKDYIRERFQLMRKNLKDLSIEVEESSIFEDQANELGRLITDYLDSK